MFFIVSGLSLSSDYATRLSNEFGHVCKIDKKELVNVLMKSNDFVVLLVIFYFSQSLVNVSRIMKVAN